MSFAQTVDLSSMSQTPFQIGPKFTTVVGTIYKVTVSFTMHVGGSNSQRGADYTVYWNNKEGQTTMASNACYDNNNDGGAYTCIAVGGFTAQYADSDHFLSFAFANNYNSAGPNRVQGGYVVLEALPS